MSNGMGLEELRAEMERIKDTLAEMYCDKDETTRREIVALQHEAMRMAREYLEIRQEQKAAISFVEELIDSG